MRSALTVHGIEELLIALGLAQLFEKKLHRIDHVHAGEDLAQQPDALQAGGIDQQLLAAGSCLVPPDRAFLEARCDELEAELAALSPRLTANVIHGDAWQGNLLVRSGAAVLCDLDQVSAGPREWDLVPTVVNALRFGFAAPPVQRFLDAYGFDVIGWDGFPVLRKVRELVMLAGVVPVLSSSPGIATEFARRMYGLRNGREDRWTPYR